MTHRQLALGALTAWAVSTHAQLVFDNSPWGDPTASESAGAWNVPLYDPEVGYVTHSDYQVLRQSFTTPATDVTASVLHVTLRLEVHSVAQGLAFRIEDGASTEYFSIDWVEFVGGPGDYTFAMNSSYVNSLGYDEPTATLAANTRYYLTLFPSEFPYGSSYALGWYYAAGDSPEVADFWGHTGIWPSSGTLAGDLALRIVAVPEPGQFAVIGALGLGAWAVVRRRGKRVARDPNRDPLALPREAEAQVATEL